MIPILASNFFGDNSPLSESNLTNQCKQKVNMVQLNVHSNHKAYQGRGEGGGKGVWRGKGEERDYTYRYAVTTRMSPALRWAATESHFNVSLIVRDRVTRQ